MMQARKLLLALVSGAALCITACSGSANAQRGDDANGAEMALSNAQSNPDMAALVQQNEALQERVDILEDEARAAREASMPLSDLLLWLVALLGLAAGIFAMLRMRGAQEEIDRLRASRQKTRSSPDPPSDLQKDLNALKEQVRNMSSDYLDFKRDTLSKLSAGGAVAAANTTDTEEASAAKYAAVDTSRQASSPTSSGDAAAQPKPDDGALLKKIVSAFNAIEKPEDIAAFEKEFTPMSYTNDRNSGVAHIFEDRRARFWLIKSANFQDTAYLIPGADAKKNWLKFKDKTPDHPFEHHFALHAGANLRLIEPAVVSQAEDGWEVRTQGQIEGVQ